MVKFMAAVSAASSLFSFFFFQMLEFWKAVIRFALGDIL